MFGIVLGRFLNGVGGGFVTASALAAIAVGVPDQERPRALAYMSGVWFPSAVFVPQLASWLRALADWRAAYALVVVVALTAALLTPAFPASAGRREEQAGGARMALASVAGLILFMIAVNAGLALVYTLLLVAASALVLGFSLTRVFPPGTLRAEEGLPAAFAVRGLFGFALLALQAFETFAIIRVLDAPGWLVGTALAATELGLAVGGFLLAKLHRRYEASTLLRLAAAVSVLGVLGFCATIVLGLPAPLALLPMFVRHIGFGMGQNGSAEAITLLSPTDERGRTSATGNAAITFGLTVGPALVGVAFAHLSEIPGEIRGAIVFATCVSLLGYAMILWLAGRVRHGAANREIAFAANPRSDVA